MQPVIHLTDYKILWAQGEGDISWAQPDPKEQGIIPRIRGGQTYNRNAEKMEARKKVKPLSESVQGL